MTFQIFQNHLSFQAIADEFYYCTHLPIIFYNETSHTVYVKGALHRFDLNDILKQVNDSLGSEFSVQGYYFKSFPVCRVNPCHGFYIIGPYIKDDQKKASPVYRSEYALIHLEALLKSLSHDEGCNHSAHKNAYIDQAVFEIISRFYEPLTIDSVSDKLGINKSYFCQLFKKHTDKTFTALLNEVRIEHSKTLLENQNDTILNVALAVGFNNQNYFNMVFKKHTGMTPKAYRQLALKRETDIKT